MSAEALPVIDLAERRLTRAGASVPVRRKVFDLLALFASNEGRLLRREEILAAVWDGRHLSESVLKGCVRELHRALGDDAREPRFVEAVPGLGYRFLGGVELRTTGSGAFEPGRAPAPTVAVSPFTGPRGNLGALAALAAAELATALAGHEHLRLVPARRDPSQDGGLLAAHAFDREVGARHVVTGDLLPAGRGARLHVRLVDAEAGLLLWADGIALRRPLDRAARGAARRASGEIAARLLKTVHPSPATGTQPWGRTIRSA
jgi:DNA-binding winged helix-turn-helix (wHTH) protein